MCGLNASAVFWRRSALRRWEVVKMCRPSRKGVRKDTRVERQKGRRSRELRRDDMGILWVYYQRDDPLETQFHEIARRSTMEGTYK
jgi:hypothetical protein